MVKRSKRMKFESCVLQVKKKSKGRKGKKVNPFAVCRVSTRFKGSTKTKNKNKNKKKPIGPGGLIASYFD